MADLIDRIELMRQIAEFGREIPKDQVMEVIARVPTESSESEKHQLQEEIPTNTPTDLISRQDAIDTLKRVAGVGNRAIDALKNMPTMDRPRPIDPTIRVDLESGVVPISACEPKGPKTIIYADRPKGEWKCMSDCGVTECDQCGWSIEEYVGDYNFCPNCGADMRGENE